MKRFALTLTALAAFSLSTAAAPDAPYLFVMPSSVQPLKPGSALPAAYFDADKRVATLPGGRQMLYVLRAGDVSRLLDDPAAHDLTRLRGVKGLSVLVVPEVDRRVPAQAETREALERALSPLPVLFDDRETVDLRVQEGGFLYGAQVAGLYFLNDRRVLARYLHGGGGWSASQSLTLIQAEIARFAAGKPLERYSAEPALIGSTLPAGTFKPGGVTLLTRTFLTGATAAQPKSDVQRFWRDTLERLATFARGKNLALRAVAMEGDAAGLKNQFPDWEFVNAATPQDFLRWYGLQTAVLDGRGRVVAHVAALPSPQAGEGLLRAAVEEAK